MSPIPKISVIIPVKNEAAGMAACLDGILSQSVPVLEILVIDSGSTDGTQDIVRRYDIARLIESPPESFNHGDTRNLGVRAAKGEFVLCTVGDARAYDDHWIAHLLAGFVDDQVAAVWGHQCVPQSPKTNPLEWFQPVSEPQLEVFRFDSPAAFEQATPDARKAACGLDDVTALYRTAALLQVPFRRIVYGEDMMFASDAYKAGFALARNPAARVYHFHLEDYQTTVKKAVTLSALSYSVFGVEPGNPQSNSVMNALRLLKNSRVGWREKLRWWAYNQAQFKGLSDGVTLVQRAILEGADSLTILHEKYAGTPPVPLKPYEKSHA